MIVLIEKEDGQVDALSDVKSVYTNSYGKEIKVVSSDYTNTYGISVPKRITFYSDDGIVLNVWDLKNGNKRD